MRLIGGRGCGSNRDQQSNVSFNALLGGVAKRCDDGYDPRWLGMSALLLTGLRQCAEPRVESEDLWVAARIMTMCVAKPSRRRAGSNLPSCMALISNKATRDEPARMVLTKVGGGFAANSG